MPLLLPLFNLLRRLGWKDYALGGLGAAIAALGFLFYKEHGDLVQSRLVYLHPAVQQSQSKTVRQEPTVIEKKIYRMSWQDFAAANPDEASKLIAARPFGSEPYGGPVEVTEEKTTVGAKTESTASARDTHPVPLSETVAPRSDRWLVSAGLCRLSSDYHGKALLVGYGFRNRVDVQAGLTNDDRTRLWALATFRF